jgi:PAS domain S-box-containing protein
MMRRRGGLIRDPPFLIGEDFSTGAVRESEVFPRRPFRNRLLTRAAGGALKSNPPTVNDFFSQPRSFMRSTRWAKRLRSLGLAALLGFLLTAPFRTYSERLPVKVYTTADGLARDSIARIVRDSKGFLWFCTSEGLSRFDGYDFTNYGVDQGLPSRIVNDFIETRQGQYWVATNNGLCLFDPAARIAPGAARRFSFDYQGDGTRGIPINAVLEDRSGAIWCGGLNGLFRLEQRNGQWVCARVEVGGAATGPKKDFEIRGLLEDRRGALWMTISDGLYRREPDGRMTRFADRKGERTNILKSALLEDRAGRVWVGTVAGLYRLPPEPGPDALAAARVYTVRDGLAGDSINSLFQTSDGRILVGSNTGFSEYLPPANAPDSGRSAAAEGRPVFRRFTRENGLNDAGVGPITEDRNGNLWIGAESGGAMKIASNGFTTYGEADGFRGSRIGALTVDQAGKICIVSAEGFINRFDGGRFESAGLRLPSGYSYTGWGWHQTMFQSRAGEWWMQMGYGVIRYPLLSRLTQLTNARPQAIYKANEDLAGSEIFRIYEDTRGDVWIGALAHGSDTLTRWERQAGIFHRFTAEDGLMTGDTPSAFAEDASGGVWIGFYYGKLARYSEGRLRWIKGVDGLPAGFIRGLYFDQAHRLWVATAEGGVVRIDDPLSDRPRSVVYNMANGLSSNQATAITEDQWGRIYVGTGRGLDRIDVTSGAIRRYTTADGLPSNFINVAARDREGALWFGTLRGVSRLVPRPEPPVAPPPILFRELRVGGELLPISPMGETAISGLTLGADRNQLRISFFGLSFGPGESLRYQYKLDGANADWNAPTDVREVDLANLAPGSYRFSVRAVTADGARSQTPATVSFKVLPPVYRRWWFLTLVALLIGAGVFAFDRYRVARLNELNGALRQSQRLTEELTANQAELRLANRTLKLESTLARILTESATLSEAAPRLLQAICENTGWKTGAIWDADPQSGVLRCLEVWGAPEIRAEEFAAATRESLFPPGHGLPGRVFESREAHWVADVEGDENFPRHRVAALDGLRSAFGFPVLRGAEVVGVIEFFSREPRQPDRDLLTMMSAVGARIGQLIERKRAEQAIRESETRFRTLAETASDAIITIDEASFIVFVNPAAEKIFGYTAEEMLGEELTMLMPDYLRHLHQAGLARYQQTGRRHIDWTAIELPGLHRDGSELPLEISFGEFNKDGRRFFTGIARDVSERKRAEEALRRSREERLAELERVRRRIATDLHDDIGSSLTQISILSEVMRQRVGDQEETINEPLRMIAGASRELVDSMSDIVWAINPQKDHLSDLTQRMRRFAADSFTARRIKFDFSVSGVGSVVGQDIKLGANLRREIFLIFKESVNNMIKHSDCAKADIDFRVDEANLVLRLRDDGRGFDPGRESDGHGLISMRDRARGIGGNLEIHSAPGNGVTVTLTVALDPQGGSHI